MCLGETHVSEARHGAPGFVVMTIYWLGREWVVCWPQTIPHPIAMKLQKGGAPEFVASLGEQTTARTKTEAGPPPAAKDDNSNRGGQFKASWWAGGWGGGGRP